MRLIEINEAEAIIEPFYDGGTSDPEDSDPRYCVLHDYKIQACNGARIQVQQGWAFAGIQIVQTTPNLPILKMERDCDIDICEYDTFIVFGSIPTQMAFDLEAEIDGKMVTLGKEIYGTGVSEEYNFLIQGRRLTHLFLVFYAEQENSKAELNWFGLMDTKRLKKMLEHKNHYDAQWSGYFIKNPDVFAPKLNLLFDRTELTALQEKLKKSPFCEIYTQKKEKAQRDMEICPESYIGRFVPQYDRRWNRSRDKEWALDLTKNACGMHTVIENLAFVGLIEQNQKMLCMAARHAICIAHCEYWCESPMGILPGATWHHRSFTENHYCTTLALILDWCGNLLTPFAEQVLRDALVMKGLPRIESDFHRCEYIRHMNQGIVFSQGRIFAQLALLPRYPRYAADLEQAEADLIEMIGNYVQPDGGVLEGPGYWMFTFNEVLPAFYALARYHKEPFTYYRKLFSKTGRFELAMLSMEDNRTVLHPINDCHPNLHVSCMLANSFYQFTGEIAWKNLYERLMEQKHVDEDTFALISSPLPDGFQIAEEEIDRIFPITGQIGITRKGRDLETRIHLCSGATCPTHYHQDKGSLLLEADGKVLCPDCGNGNYFDSELSELYSTQAHSILCPIYKDGRTATQGRYEAGSRILFVWEEKGMDTASDDTAAWSDDPYVSAVRRIRSPIAELVIVEDIFQLKNADSVLFQLNCYEEWQIEADYAHTAFGTIKLSVVPLNWKWSHAQVRRMQDGDHKPVWQLCAAFQGARQADLLTAIWVEDTIKIEVEQLPNGWCFKQADQSFWLQKEREAIEWNIVSPNRKGVKL